MKKEKVRREKVLDACVWAGVALVVAAWLAFLFFQRGNRLDEAEHTHVAWLISRGQRPLIDFFQHHQPLLWSVLALYFRVGLRGPGVLIWGQILVVLSGLVSVVILLQLGRAPGTSRRHIFGFLGAGAFISLTVMIHALFVIRPETISAPLFLVGLWLWCKAGRPRWEMITVAAAGALAGAACYSSPRFALAGGLFLSHRGAVLAAVAGPLRRGARVSFCVHCAIRVSLERGGIQYQIQRIAADYWP